ncbi:MAG: hypothetical protein HF962_04410 [Sulfurovum sp.]|nr:hypothetical protein [Sulfurovum sp.]
MSNDNRRKKTKRPYFIESEIKLALTVLEKLEKPLELFYYLMRKNEKTSTVIMLLSADGLELKEMLLSEKRDSDLLVEIDKENQIFAIACQETSVDEGYRFALRLRKHLQDQGLEKLYLAEVEISSQSYSEKDVLLKLVDLYVGSVRDEKNNETVFYSFY